MRSIFMERSREYGRNKNEQQPHSFKRKLGNTTYTAKVHFSKNIDKTFKDRVQNLIINECFEKN